jgi:signal transduction histidine kinase
MAAAAHARAGRRILSAFRQDALGRWLSLILLMMLCTLSQAASARDWIDRLSIIQEQGSVLSIEEVRERSQWRIVRDYVSLGFTPSAVWLRIELSPEAPAVPLRLRIRPVYLDQIEVYAPDAAGGWSRQRLGDRFPRGGNALSDTAFSAALHGRHGGPIYVRVQTSSTMAIYPEVLDESDSSRAATFEHLIFGVYFGLMAFLACWAVISAWVRRDPAIALFAIYLFALIGLGLGITGLTSFLSPIGVSDLWTSVFVLVSTLVGALFHRFFVSRYELNRWVLRVVDLCIAWAALNLLLLAVTDPRLPLMANAWLVLSTSIVMSAAAFISAGRARADHRPLLVAYGVVLILLAFTMLPVVGGGIGGELAIHLPMGHGLIIAVTLTLVIARQGRIDLLDRQRLRLTSEQTNRELRLISEQNQEYDRFLAMLTHELRNALSIATLVIRRLQSGEYSGARSVNQAVPDAPPLAALVKDPEVATSLARASSALRSASGVLDKVQAARRFEQEFQHYSSTENFSERLAEVIGRLNIVNLSSRVAPELTLAQDWTYVELILANLIENADRYREPGTSITIDAGSLPGQPAGVRFTIANQLSPNAVIDPDRIFDKYWRDPHAGSRRGAGLGLWLSQNAARLLGGELTCRVKGSAIEFRLTLPDSRAAPVALPGSDPASGEGRLVAPSLPGARQGA